MGFLQKKRDEKLKAIEADRQKWQEKQANSLEGHLARNRANLGVDLCDLKQAVIEIVLGEGDGV